MLLKICGPRQRRVATDVLFRVSMDLYFVPDVDARQVFPHFQWSRISFSGMRYKFRRVERHDMRIDSQFRLRLAEDRSGLLRSGVVIDYFLLSQVVVKVIAGSV